jgi:hypothetical protein
MQSPSAIVDWFPLPRQRPMPAGAPAPRRLETTFRPPVQDAQHCAAAPRHRPDKEFAP